MIMNESHSMVSFSDFSFPERYFRSTDNKHTGVIRFWLFDIIFSSSTKRFPLFIESKLNERFVLLSTNRNDKRRIIDWSLELFKLKQINNRILFIFRRHSNPLCYSVLFVRKSLPLEMLFSNISKNLTMPNHWQ